VPTATLDPSTEAMSAEEAAACDELLRLAVASEAMSEEEAEACAESLRTPAFYLHCGREQAPPSLRSRSIRSASVRGSACAE
jgi:hypothetical protein